MQVRIETDSMGSIEVPGDRYWGAQTQRSMIHFAIGVDRFKWPLAMIRALGLVKKAAILANKQLKLLPDNLSQAMLEAVEEVISGQLDQHFPLVVFQTGSGTHSNMNMNGYC